MGRTVLFANGGIADYAWHRSRLRGDDVIIAVDGGGRHCLALGLRPDLAIGDFDSLPENVASFYRERQVPCRRFPADKDATDLALALEAALERGAKEILVFGALGGPRLDMELGNVLALLPFAGKGDISLAAEGAVFRVVCGGEEVAVAGEPGDYVSLFAIGAPFITGKSQNLKYQLENLSFAVGETRGISNELTAPSASFLFWRERGFSFIKSGTAALKSRPAAIISPGLTLFFPSKAQGKTIYIDRR